MGGTRFFFNNDDTFINNEDVDALFQGDLPFRVAQQEQYAAYVQDEWRLRPNFMLNLGMRYEYYSATREEKDRALLLDPAELKLTAAHGGFYHPSKLGVNPRLALTWAPQRLKGNTVLRAGAGIYQGPFAMLDTLLPIENTAPRAFLRAVAIPQTPASILANPATLTQPQALDLGSFRTPQRNMTYSVSVQQALPFQLVGQAGYVGILSRHLTQQGVANVGTGVDSDGAEIRPESEFRAIRYLTNGGTSSYHAMQLGLSRRFVDSLTVSGSYNWSHSIGSSQGAGDQQAAQDPHCLACERADNTFDVRQTVSLNLVYGLPFGKNQRRLANGWIGALAGGWTVAAALNVRTGLPVNVIIDRPDEIYYNASAHKYYRHLDDDPTGAAIAVTNTPGGGEDRIALRPNVVPGVNPYLRDKHSRLWINSAAFATPAAGSFGTLGRNALRGPGFS